jgi:hypothetical protein
LNRRVPLVVGAAIAALLVGNGLYASFTNSSVSVETDVRHKVDLVASVNSINADSNWKQDGVTSNGTLQLSLDDMRILMIPEGTLVDDYDAMPQCIDFSTPNACVLLADMLGDAVVWFALVPADKVSGMQTLTLPGLVDMQANGDEGILRNGWVVKLATPVKRNCENTDTTTLRDFLTRFPDDASTSSVNLTTDNVVSVTCK